MLIDEILKEEISTITESRVRDAMEYSLMAGGKRIRPTLLFTVLKGYGVDPMVGRNFAAALEMVHTYSLIHDDLPAMDNDDLRRGRPTCHKQFDEATAILAGDGLLTQAFVTASKADVSSDKTVACIQILSKMAGPDGMVYGQCLDMEEDSSFTMDDIRKVQKYKTGCLLSAPLMMAAVLADQSSDTIEHWHRIGDEIGLAFQIQDDILDVTESAQELGKSNSDERNQKVTSVSLVGREKAESMMNSLYDDACEEIRKCGGFEPEELISMIRGIQTRKK